MMTVHSPFKDLPVAKLVLLARHMCRMTGFLTLKLLMEYFPSIDMKSILFIVDNLVQSSHIKRTASGYYRFIDLGKDMENGELQEEIKVLDEVKKGVLQSVCVNIPSKILDSALARGETEKNSGETDEPAETAETLPKKSLAEEFSKLALSSHAVLPGSGEEQQAAVQISSVPHSQHDLYSRKPRSSESSTHSSATSSVAFGRRPAVDSFFDEEFQRKLDQCVRPPPPLANVLAPTDVSSTPSAKTAPATASQPDSTTPAQTLAADLDSFLADANSSSSKTAADQSPCGAAGQASSTPIAFDKRSTTLVRGQGSDTPALLQEQQQQQQRLQHRISSSPAAPVAALVGAPPPTAQYTPRMRTESASQFHWKKPQTQDAVRDPCRAVEVFCELKTYNPPAYTVTYMPNDNVYFCLLLVGNTSYKSYPTLARTEKRAMEVAAEKAVQLLGITNSMVLKKSLEQTVERK